MQQRAVQSARQQHPRPRGGAGQSGGLQQAAGPIHTKPTVLGPEQCGATLLGRGHDPLCQQGTSPLRQFGDVPAAGALAQQLHQGWGQAATAAMGRQVQGQGLPLRLE
jgi:hypothetical protein